MVACRSLMASINALWDFGLIRLISSTRRMFAKTGPFLSVKSRFAIS
jgi:hypothetical protein